MIWDIRFQKGKRYNCYVEILNLITFWISKINFNKSISFNALPNGILDNLVSATVFLPHSSNLIPLNGFRGIRTVPLVQLDFPW